MTLEQPTDPPCHRTDCTASNHCPVHDVHHAVDSLVDACIARSTPAPPERSSHGRHTPR